MLPRYIAFSTPGRGPGNKNTVRPQPKDAIVDGQRAKFGFRFMHKISRGFIRYSGVAQLVEFQFRQAY